MMKKQPKKKPKPKLVQLHPDKITFDNIMRMVRTLLGRDPTPEEIEETKGNRS